LSAFGVSPGVASDASPSNETIGIVGCSNSRQHIEGYNLVSDLGKFWDPASLELGGGTVSNWASDLSDRNPHWADFAANLQQFGGNAVWLQLCIRDGDASSSGITLEQRDQVEAVIGEIQRRTGGVTVYISPLNQYVANDCSATGAYGVPNSIELADWASAAGLAQRGPDTGPLDHSQLKKDLCHLGPAGLILVGGQMAGYFDATLPTADFTFSPRRPQVDEEILFQDLSTDDGAIVNWSWSFGNGVVRTGQDVLVRFRSAGTYEVTLSVTDDDNNIAVVKKSVTVAPAGDEPTRTVVS
jgi:PKD repeat protein